MSRLLAFCECVFQQHHEAAAEAPRQDVKSVGVPEEDPLLLRPVKDDLELKTLACTACSVNLDSSASIRLAVPSRPRSRCTSATSVWRIQASQPWPNTSSTWTTAFNTTILFAKSRYRTRMVREPNEIELHHNNVNRIPFT